MWPVFVLLWKHCLNRRRRYFRTLFDYASPILFFILLHLLSDPANENKHEQIHYTEPFNLDSKPRMRLLYTPDTDFTNQLMDRVGAKLNLKRLDHLPRHKEKGYFPFSNASALADYPLSSSILEYSKEMKPTDAIVVFEDMEKSDTWPKKLNYTIRMKYSFKTYQYEPEDIDDLGSHEFFGREYEPFMQLQWAIDTSYLYLMSGAEVPHTLTLQEFPLDESKVNKSVLITCVAAALLLPLALQLTFIFLAGRLFEEKNSGIHELVKMTGVSWEALSFSHVLDVVPNLLIYAVGGVITCKFSGIIPNTNGLFIFIAMTLHFLTVVAMAFAVVYIFNISQYIELTTMAVYSVFWAVSLASASVKNLSLALLLCFLPHLPFAKFWLLMGVNEMFGEGVTLSNMWSTQPPGYALRQPISVGGAYLIMLGQAAFFSMLAWYLSRVRPGKFGQALPWNFPFKKEYWTMKAQVDVAPEETHFAPEDINQKKYFEKPPPGVSVGVQINDVYKLYGKEEVLHGVNMGIFKGEITVLLGHNGAGKTTLISIIAGQISATSGNVLVEGKDTFKQSKEVRKLIGLCPQQNTFFPNITVQEHAMFFAMLKGQTYAESKASAAELFSKLRLSEKANSQIEQLSGGMKRRAQLCCAIAGGASVLMLDEPTSGLDVETRRELWDLLLSLRGNHTVLLTTHFMEEADALGDRVVALHSGVVRCHATPMFLKRAIGTGYRVSFTTIGAPKESAITSTITNIVPDATVRDQAPNSISYNLPAKDTSRFPQLFHELEERRSELGIDTIGVGKSTLDEVFLELCSDVKPSLAEEGETAVKGTGYRVSFTTIGAPKESAITSTITNIVPDATVRDQAPNSISYNLPAKDTSRFPQLFRELEERRSELGIDTIGVGKSTLDGVFLELCSDVKPSLAEEGETAVKEPTLGKMSGAALWARQFIVLLGRQVLFILSRKVSFLVISLIVIILLWLFVAVSNNQPFGMTVENKLENEDIALNLDFYNERQERRAMVDVDSDTLAALRTGYRRVHFEEVTDIPDKILRTSKQNIREYNKYLVGIELNDTNAKALYTTSVRHAAPVALNLVSNAIAARTLGGADGHSITTRNYPLKGAFVPYAETAIVMTKNQQGIGVFAVHVAMMIGFYLSSLARLPILERVTGTRHQHIMAGVPLPLHWAATLLTQFAQAVAVCLVPTVIFALTVEADHTIDQAGFIVVMCALLLLGILAFLSMVYLVSTLSEQSTASWVLPVAAFVFTQVTPMVPEGSGIASYLVYVPYFVMPPHTLVIGLMNTLEVAQANAYCELNRKRCPSLVGPGLFETSKCCESSPGSEPWSYWLVSRKGAGRELLILAAQMVVYLALTYFSDRGVLARLYAGMTRAVRPPPRYDDSVVRAESAYVEKAIKLPKKQITDAILVHNLQKNYPSILGKKKSFFAVRGISFSVKKGECFGLLGVNGAGKTSTFKMLTAETAPTDGEIFANGHTLSDRAAYMNSFSYCPQFFGLDDFLTGRQNLILVMTLRGFRDPDVKNVADSWIEEVGLSRHANKRVSSYSGGCARRLAAAAALCQGAPTALLDEPTAGVDPSARRRMHQALLRAKKTQSLIIASHSLDEIEALCHRIAIMSGGELCALGSASALKAQHAAGYSVVFKLAAAQDVPDGVNKLDEFKGELHRRFECTLQDQHQTMLNYHIKDTLRYSELFDSIEKLKQQHPGLLDDYTVTETTLEEVFLAFAKEAREPRPDA